MIFYFFNNREGFFIYFFIKINSKIIVHFLYVIIIHEIYLVHTGVIACSQNFYLPWFP